MESWDRSLSHREVFIKSFCKSQFPHKFVDLFSTLVLIKEKLTDLWGNWLLQNDFLCEIKASNVVGSWNLIPDSARQDTAVVKWFWQLMESWSPARRSAVLQLATGTFPSSLLSVQVLEGP